MPINKFEWYLTETVNKYLPHNNSFWRQTDPMTFSALSKQGITSEK